MFTGPVADLTHYSAGGTPASQTFETFTLNYLALTGARTSITAKDKGSLSGTDQNGNPVSDAGASASATWTLAPMNYLGQLAIATSFVSPSTLETGEPVVIQVNLTNNGDRSVTVTPSTGTPIVYTVQPAGTASANAGVYVKSASATPITINPKGGTASFNLTIATTGAAAEDRTRAAITVNGTDSGSNAVSVSDAVGKDFVVLANSSTLDVASVSFVSGGTGPNTTNVSKAIRLQVAVSNTGGATLDMSSSSFLITSGANNLTGEYTAMLVSPATPVTFAPRPISTTSPRSTATLGAVSVNPGRRHGSHGGVLRRRRRRDPIQPHGQQMTQADLSDRSGPGTSTNTRACR